MVGKVIDIHAHVQPPEVVADRVPFVEHEPDFKLLYENPKYRLSSSGDVLLHMDECGVSESVLLGFAWRDPLILRRHNDVILSDCASSGGRFHGFTCIYPFAPGTDAADETRRCLEKGAAGIVEIGLYNRDLDYEYINAMAPVMAVCREYDRPVMMHVNEPIGHVYSGKAPMSLRGIYNFVRAYPDNRIILAHWGGGLFFFSSLKKEAKDVLANVWFDSAASPYLYDKKIWRLAVEIAGADRVLFGTDFPLLKANTYLEELKESGLDDEAIEMICFRNARELLSV